MRLAGTASLACPARTGWLHRYLLQEGIENLVVDSASIEVNRRAKRATLALAGSARETNRIDVGKLLMMLIRYERGEKKVWSVLRVPSVEAEDKRHLHRQLMAFKAERTRHTNRIQGLRVGQGVRSRLARTGRQSCRECACGMGWPYPPGYAPGWNGSMPV